MKFVEYALLDSWYKFLNNEELTGFNLNSDMICNYIFDYNIFSKNFKKF
jgi:hypothetical protein